MTGRVTRRIAGSPLLRVRHHTHVEREGDPRRTCHVRRLRRHTDHGGTGPGARTPQRRPGPTVAVHLPSSHQDEHRCGAVHGGPPLVVRARPQNQGHHRPRPYAQPTLDGVTGTDNEVHTSGGTAPRRNGRPRGRRLRLCRGRRHRRAATPRRHTRRLTTRRPAARGQDDHPGGHRRPDPPPHPGASRPTGANSIPCRHTGRHHAAHLPQPAPTAADRPGLDADTKLPHRLHPAVSLVNDPGPLSEGRGDVGGLWHEGTPTSGTECRIRQVSPSCRRAGSRVSMLPGDRGAA